MKKAIKLIVVVLLIVGGVAAAALCVTSGYFSNIPWSDVSAEEIETYLNEKVIPIVVVVVSAVGTVMMAVRPVMNGVKRASEKFCAAEEGLKNTSAETKRTQKETKELFGNIQKSMAEMRDVCQRADEKMEALADMESRIENMMLIGFCNTPELVRGGYAQMIYDMSTKSENNVQGVENVTDGQTVAEVPENSAEGENDGEKKGDVQ